MMDKPNWILILDLVQLAGGVILLLQICYTWNRMRKLKTLITFMKQLLILLLLKSIALIGEQIYEIILRKAGQLHSGRDFSVYIHGGLEFLNWILTQLVIWVVAMRFYESSLPIKRLEKSIQRDVCTGKNKFLKFL